MILEAELQELIYSREKGEKNNPFQNATLVLRKTTKDRQMPNPKGESLFLAFLLKEKIKRRGVVKTVGPEGKTAR